MLLHIDCNSNDKCLQPLKIALQPYCCLNFQNKLNIKNINKGLIYILCVTKSSSLLPTMKGILLSYNKSFVTFVYIQWHFAFTVEIAYIIKACY